jgi:hypothetical protein
MYITIWWCRTLRNILDTAHDIIIQGMEVFHQIDATGQV